MQNLKTQYRKGATAWLNGIDRFPNIYSTRISYNRKHEKQTLTGACCTILLVIILIGIMIIYMIPVVNKQNSQLTSQLLPQSNSKYSIKYGETYLNVWVIWGTGYVDYQLDPTKITVRIEKITAQFN